MSKFRTIINLSPSFIKVMPFKCTGVNELKLESYTNRFSQVHEGLVCIFKSEFENTGPITVKLSELPQELRLLDFKGEEIAPGIIKAGRFYQATYNGEDLILHTSNSEVAENIEAGNNITIDKKEDGSIVISSIDTNTWRPISDELNSEDSNVSASSNVARILNEKVEAIKVIVAENESLQNNIADTVLEILAEIDNLKIVDNELNAKLTEVDSKVDINIREIVAIKNEIFDGDFVSKDDLFYAYAPVGTILGFAGEVIPLGFEACNGKEITAEEYPDLVEIIGNTLPLIEEVDGIKSIIKTQMVGNPNTVIDAADVIVKKITEIKNDTLVAVRDEITENVETAVENALTPIESELDSLASVVDTKADADHSHSNATTTNNGLMSSTDKSKLDGIANNANNYVHPGSGTNPHGTTKADVGLNAVNNWGASSAIGANSTSEYATTNLVAQVRSEKLTKKMGSETTANCFQEKGYHVYVCSSDIGTDAGAFPATYTDVFDFGTNNASHGLQISTNYAPNSHGYYIRHRNDRPNDNTEFPGKTIGAWARIYTDKNKPTPADIGAAPTNHTHGDPCPYRVGDILTTTLATNPATNWPGTTWQKIEGRYLRGTSGSEASKLTGGSMTKTLAIGNLPAHNHGASGSSNSVGDHAHTANHGHTASQPAHNHTANHNHSATQAVHNHSNAAHSHVIPTYQAGNGTMTSFGGTTLQRNVNTNSAGGNTSGNAQPAVTVNTTNVTTSNAQPGVTVNNTNVTTSTTGAHSHTISVSTSNTGSGTAFNIEPSYYTVHYWLRTV